MAISAEIEANNIKIEALASARTRKEGHGEQVTQNVAAGVPGLLVWPLFFAMDFLGAASKMLKPLPPDPVRHQDSRFGDRSEERVELG